MERIVWFDGRFYFLLRFCEQGDVEFDARHDRKYHNTREGFGILLDCLMDML